MCGQPLMGWVIINKYGIFCKHSEIFAEKKERPNLPKKLLKGGFIEIYPRESNQRLIFPVFLQDETLLKMKIYFANKVLWRRVSDPMLVLKLCVDVTLPKQFVF